MMLSYRAATFVVGVMFGFNCVLCVTADFYPDEVVLPPSRQRGRCYRSLHLHSHTHGMVMHSMI